MEYKAPYGAVDPNAAYVNGNPATGTAGSVPPAAAIEHPQREIVAVIEDADIVPDDSDLTQLLQAIKKIAGNEKPLYGFYAEPAVTFTVGTATPTTITTFGPTVNGLPNSTFSSGVLTIGSGDEGYYIISSWLGTNMTAPISSDYGWTHGIDVDRGSGYATRAGIAAISSTAATNGPFSSCSLVYYLDVGDKVRCGITQNSGGNQNAPCGLSAIFLGR
jgi:hypothetical protein